MKFYARYKDKILIYNYVPNKAKIYDFKKREIENEKEGPHWVCARIETKRDYYGDGNLEIKSTDIKDLSWLNYIEDESIIPDERKKELLEAYYRANANDYRRMEELGSTKPMKGFCLGTYSPTDIEIDNKGIILPPSINASIDKAMPDTGYTDEAIVINENLIMLETIQLGFIYFDCEREYDLINNTDVLECFDFSQEDEINISALEVLYKDENMYQRAEYHEPETNIFQYTLNMANKGARIIKRVNQLKR